MANDSIILYTLSDFAPVCRVTVSVERNIQLCHGFDRPMTSKKGNGLSGSGLLWILISASPLRS